MFTGGFVKIGPFKFFVLFKGPFLVALDLKGQGPSFSVPEAEKRWLEKVRAELEGYFGGAKNYPDFENLRLEVPNFTRRCLELLREIPRGEVRTYGWLADRVGSPGALRAVGRALARNPLPLFYPCHRIVAKNGLGGFSAGREWKRLLLAWEGVRF
ncbi:MAG TPA: MGMT family protein [Thermodesulfobacteriaceae bacterium]|nr:MGMT family protein [Thermodesulfobacteriaceae bacterium]